MSNKDWDGDYRGVFTTLGASNHTKEEREKDDYYATDPIAIDKLIGGGATIPEKIWECSCGDGSLSKRLEELGYTVYSTDLVDRGYGTGGLDFLKTTEMPEGYHCILTNPPYKFAQEFIEHALDIMEDGDKIFMFLKLTFLEGKKRRELFDTKQLSHVYVSSSRILCAKNGDFAYMKEHGGSAVAYGWYEFIKGSNDLPKISWIN